MKIARVKYLSRITRSCIQVMGSGMPKCTVQGVAWCRCILWDVNTRISLCTSSTLMQAKVKTERENTKTDPRRDRSRDEVGMSEEEVIRWLRKRHEKHYRPANADQRPPRGGWTRDKVPDGPEGIPPHPALMAAYQMGHPSAGPRVCLAHIGHAGGCRRRDCSFSHDAQKLSQAERATLFNRAAALWDKVGASLSE